MTVREVPVVDVVLVPVLVRDPDVKADVEYGLGRFCVGVWPRSIRDVERRWNWRKIIERQIRKA